MTTTKQEIEDAIRARLKPGMSRDQIKEVTGDVLRMMMAPDIVVEDAASEEDRAAGRMRATVRVSGVPHDTAAQMLADVPGTTIRIADSVELLRFDARAGDYRCDICGEQLADGELVVHGSHSGNPDAEDGYAHADCHLAAEQGGAAESEAGR